MATKTINLSPQASDNTQFESNRAVSTRDFKILRTRVVNTETLATELAVSVEGVTISVGKYDEGKLVGAKYTFDGTGATFFGGGITIKNNAGTNVFSADVNGNLIISGSIDAGSITTGTLSVSRIPNLDANKITTGTLSADRIAANSITATKLSISNLSSINSNLGTITGGSLNIGSGAFTVSTAGALTATSATITGVVNANSGRIGNVTFTSGTGTVNMTGNLNIDGNMTAVGSVASYSILPRANNTYSLGTSSFRWLSIWQQSGSVVGSDMSIKQDIKPIEYGIDFIMNLKPVQYKLIEGQSGRNHYGFIAQEVKEALTLSNIEDAAVFVDPTVKEKALSEEGKVKALRYDEIIAPLVMTVQSLEKRMKELENAQTS